MSSLQQQLLKFQQQQNQQLLMPSQLQSVGGATIGQNKNQLLVNNPNLNVNRGGAPSSLFLPQTQQNTLVNTTPQAALLLSQLQQQQPVQANLMLQQQLQKLQQQQQQLQQQQQQALLSAPNISSSANFIATNNVPNSSISPSPTSFANGVVSSIPTPTPSHATNTPISTTNPLTLNSTQAPSSSNPISFPPDVLAQLVAGGFDQQKIKQLLAQKHLQKQQAMQAGMGTQTTVPTTAVTNPATSSLLSGMNQAVPNTNNPTVILNRNNLLPNQVSTSILQQGSTLGGIPNSNLPMVQTGGHLQSQQPQQTQQPQIPMQHRASTSTSLTAQDMQKQYAYKADYITPFQSIEDIRNRLQVYHTLQYQPPNDNWDAKIDAVAQKFMKYPHAIRDYVNKKLNDQKRTEQEIFVQKLLAKDEREMLEREKQEFLEFQRQQQQQQQQQRIEQENHTFDLSDPMQNGLMDFQTDPTEFLEFDDLQ